MPLPITEEINPIQSDLDGQHAVQFFLGKNLAEAEALFRENSLFYQEDLMFMGPTAFRYYVQAAINYLRSDSASGDANMVRCFAGILEHRLEFEAGTLAPIQGLLASACRYLLEHHDRFQKVTETDGDLRPRFRSLLQAFEPQVELVITGIARAT